MKIYNQSGRSMIEMLGVLAIVGVLSAGGIAGYSMAMQSYKTNALIEKIQVMATQTRSLYKGNYEQIGKNRATGAQMLINAGKLTDVNNPFGGTLGTMHSNWGDAFDIRVSGGVSVETCMDLLQTDWGDSGVFEGVNVYYAESGSAALRYTNGKWPVALSDAVTHCTKGVATIDLVFR